MIESEKRAQSVSLGLRVSPEVKGLIEKLAQGISESLGGARVSLTQAVEVAIREAVAKRGL